MQIFQTSTSEMELSGCGKERQLASQKKGGAKVLTLGETPDGLEIFAWENFQERRKNTAKKNLRTKKNTN